MRSRLHVGISLVGVGVILFGVRYASGREQVHDADLRSLYQDINRESFAGQLPDISIEWADLPESYGKARMYLDGSADIQISRQIVKTDSDLRNTMHHEACHIAAREEIERLNQDDHGPALEECMKRFN
jgi:predicted SprT family Zn-dependent metalloprotease